MRGIKGFNGASSPLGVWDYVRSKVVPAHYMNFRCQCYFKLSELVNERKMKINIQKFHTNIEGYTVEKAISELCEELDVIQKTEDSANTKLAIIPKSEIKELLGRSPDFADILMMRMFFELKERPKFIKEVAYEVEEKEINLAI